MLLLVLFSVASQAVDHSVTPVAAARWPPRGRSARPSRGFALRGPHNAGATHFGTTAPAPRLARQRPQTPPGGACGSHAELAEQHHPGPAAGLTTSRSGRREARRGATYD
eukprot:11156862-Ditylum_brightwellii.AAC.1